jgi:hypothetical protein
MKQLDFKNFVANHWTLVYMSGVVTITYLKPVFEAVTEPVL